MSLANMNKLIIETKLNENEIDDFFKKICIELNEDYNKLVKSENCCETTIDFTICKNLGFGDISLSIYAIYESDSIIDYENKIIIECEELNSTLKILSLCKKILQKTIYFIW